MSRLALAALTAQIGIVVTGGAVRLTKSGLGCPTWPRCSAGSFIPSSSNSHHAVNQAIEYTNRLLTSVVLAAGIAVLVAVYRSQSRRRELVRLAWLQPLGVVAQIVLGGITVLVHLNPIAVGSHFMLSMGIIAASWVLWVRTKEGDGPPQRLVPLQVRLMARVLTGVVLALLVVGTIVTGAGPHAGDNTSPRYHLRVDDITQIHADLVWLTIGLTLALWAAVAATTSSRAPVLALRDLFIIELAQGVIGYVQYATNVPAVLVGFHILGACLVWAATLRVLTSTRDRQPPPTQIART